MRILFCNYEFPPLGGGASTASAWLARELANLGHDVHVVTAAFRGLPRLRRRGGVTVRRLPALRHRAGQSNPVEMVSFVASAAPWLLLGRRPDAVVSFHSIPSGLAAWPMSRLRGVPHVVLLRGGDVPGWLPGELERLHRLTLPLNRAIVESADCVLANSMGLRDLALQSFRCEIGVLCNGIDLRSFSPSPIPGHSHEPVLLFAGRLTSQKGLDLLLEALAHRDLRTLPWRLEVAGTGPRQRDFEEQARTLGIAGRVRFHGWLDRRELRDRYRAADIFVFPSRYEGMPNVVLEAMACGLPVLGTRIAGTEEIVRPGVNGLLVESEDGPALRDALRALLTDGEARRRMGAAARAIMEETWSWARRARELEGWLQRAVR